MTCGYGAVGVVASFDVGSAVVMRGYYRGLLLLASLSYQWMLVDAALPLMLLRHCRSNARKEVCCYWRFLSWMLIAFMVTRGAPFDVASAVAMCGFVVGVWTHGIR